MSRKAGAAQEQLESLSREQAKLFELLLQKKLQQAQQLQPQPRGVGTVTLPTSWAQQRLWFIDQLEGGGAAYNLPVAIRMRGTLDDRALRAALEALVQRHEVLRTVIKDVQGDAQQEIAPDGSFALLEFSLRGPERADFEEEVRFHKCEESNTPFDLRRGPLVRGRLLRLAASEHVLLITTHHIISDGWSVGVLIRELTELYNAYREGRDSQLAPLSIQYGDYAHWQRQYLHGVVLDSQLSYWLGQLAGAPAELQLPTDKPRPAVQGYKGQSVPVVLDAPLSAQLNLLARRRGMTLFMVLYGAWAILLARLAGQEDIVIGTPVANRRRLELEGLIGFFVNTLVLRVQVPPELGFVEFLEGIKEVTLAAFDHQDVPFEQLVEALRPERSLNRHPIFQALFVLQNAPQSDLRLSGLTADVEEVVNESSKFDLLLTLEERGGQISGCINFDSDLFEFATISRWAGCYQVLLASMVNAQHERIAELPLLTERERQTLDLFNATQANYPRDAMIHELVEQQVARTPGAVALVHCERTLTYGELNSKANQLARYLRDAGVVADQLVGICVERSPEMVVGVLGILKAGGAYLPLDPNYPRERLQYMLENAAPPVVLTQRSLRTVLPATDAKVVVLEPCCPR